MSAVGRALVCAKQTLRSGLRVRVACARARLSVRAKGLPTIDALMGSTFSRPVPVAPSMARLAAMKLHDSGDLLRMAPPSPSTAADSTSSEFDECQPHTDEPESPTETPESSDVSLLPVDDDPIVEMVLPIPCSITPGRNRIAPPVQGADTDTACEGKSTVWIIAAAAPCRSAQHTSSRAVAAVAAAIARAVVLCQGYASQKRMLSLPSISKGRTRRTSGSAPPLACILLPPLLRAVRRDRLLRRRRLGERPAPLPCRGQ